MKNLIYIFLLFFTIVSCTNNKGVYWCGDHPCINKKEREAYFKKHMIVEIKQLSKNNTKDTSNIEKIIQRTKIEEKRRIKEEKDLAKQARIEEKRRIKEEKDLAKQARIEEKRRIKEEKDLAKKIELDETKIIKKKKRISEQSVEINIDLENSTISSNSFKKLVEKITKKNTLRPYPDINDIPN